MRYRLRARVRTNADLSPKWQEAHPEQVQDPGDHLDAQRASWTAGVKAWLTTAEARTMNAWRAPVRGLIRRSVRETVHLSWPGRRM